MTCLGAIARRLALIFLTFSAVFDGSLFSLSLPVWFVGCGGWNGSVGAILGKDNRSGRVYVREVPPGLAAAQAGIQEGDEVTAVEGKPVSSMTPDELRTALRGKVGSKVTMTVVHRGETRTIQVERSPFQEAR